MLLAPDAVRPVRGVIYHEAMTIETDRAMEFIDITDRLLAMIARASAVDGVLVVHTRHTTTGILINEHEPLLLADLAAMFERLVPATAAYAHDDFSRRTPSVTPGERRNGHAHCRAALLRTSETVSIAGGYLLLGRWQRVFVVDFDGGQRREVSVTIVGSE
jgi:secondary thiamine-phosphate synthase enzyme